MNERQQRLKENLTRLMAVALRDKSRVSLLKRLPSDIFKDEDAVIYSVLQRFSNDKITLDSRFLQLFLSGNKKVIQNNKLVDLTVLDEFSSYPLEEYIKLVIKRFNYLVALDISEEDINNIELIILTISEDYKHIETLEILDKAKTIALDTLKEGRKELSGVDDAMEYATRHLSSLSRVDDVAAHTFVRSAKDVLNAMSMEGISAKSRLVCDFGPIPTLNNAYGGGLRTGYLYSVMGLPKAGKTKFSLRLLHTALVKYKVNCYHVLLEGGGFEKAMAELRAIHFEWYYQQSGKFGASRSNFLPLTSQQIKDGNYPSEELRILEEESYNDLMDAASGYGTLYIPDMKSDVSLETLPDLLEDIAKPELNIQFVLFDYLQILPSSDTRLKSNEVIARAYTLAGNFAMRNNVCFVSPAQLGQESINTLLNAKNPEEIDLRTAAGGSAEAIRRPDGLFVLYANTTDLAQQEVRVLPIPTRITSITPMIKLYTELGYNYFSEILGDEADRL